jgi:hypothetical protein
MPDAAGAITYPFVTGYVVAMVFAAQAYIFRRRRPLASSPNT